jgi:hypothetical protein
LAETGDAEHAIAVARLRLEHGERSVLNEFYRVAFREKVYCSIDVLQADLDVWIREYNEQRPHQGRWCFGKTPMQTFLDANADD